MFHIIILKITETQNININAVLSLILWPFLFGTACRNMSHLSDVCIFCSCLLV